MNNLKAILMAILLVVGCAKNTLSPSNSDMENILKNDITPPKITNFTKSYADEGPASIQDLSSAKFIFSNQLTNWQMDGATRNQSHLPYFEVTAEDSDTSYKRLNLYYYFYREDGKENDLDFVPLTYVSPKTWRIYVSQDTVGEDKILFFGQKKFTLKVKVTDGVNEPVFDKIEFFVNNERPAVEVIEDPALTIELAYSNLSTLIESEEENTSLVELRNKKPLAEPVIVSKYLVVNRSMHSVYLKNAFSGNLNYIKEPRRSFWLKDEKIGLEKYSPDSYSEAPVWMALYRLDGEKLEEIPQNEAAMIELTPNQTHGVQRGIVILLLSRFDYKYENIEHPSGLVTHFVETFFVRGNLDVSFSPLMDGLPSRFYDLEHSWVKNNFDHILPIKTVSFPE